MSDQRPGGIEQDQVDSGVFPFDAFTFTRSGAATPTLSLKSGWTFDVAGDLRGRIARISKSDESYTIAGGDLPCVIKASATTADRTLTLPTAADNAGKWLWVVRTDSTAAYTLIIDGEGAEVIYNGGTSFATLGIADSAANRAWLLWCDGAAWYKMTPPVWHKVVDPTTGNIASKTSWADATFGNGLTVDFSSVVPVGTLAVRAPVQAYHASTVFDVHYRKDGDTNISDTPSASGESSHRIMVGASSWPVVQVVMWLSSAYKVQIASANTTGQVYVSYPVGYLQ